MWLLVGGDSEIGAASRRYFTDLRQPVCATTRRHDLVSIERPFLDIASPLEQWNPPAGTKAACIFSAVGRLALCAADPVGSARVNVAGTLALVDRLLAHGIYVLFLSSNQVFDGSRSCMPVDAPLSPVSEYGKQKAKVETALRGYMRRGAPVGVLRLSKVLSPEAALFHEWRVALSAGNSIQAFDDMRFAPVPIDLVCKAIAGLLRDRSNDVYQLSGPRDLSYGEAARHMAARIGRSANLVQLISSGLGQAVPGATPLHTTLASVALQDRYGIHVPDLLEVIEHFYLSKPQ